MTMKNHSFQVLFLDADRNPIKNQLYKLYFNGAMVASQTGQDGLTKKIRATSPDDQVQIAVERMDKSLKIVARVVAGAGSKLVTLISPKIKVNSPTLPHFTALPGQIPSRKEASPPIYTRQDLKNPTTKKDFGAKTELVKNREGNPISKVEGDIPNLDFLDNFNGEVMTEDDYLWASKEIVVELAAIKAFAVVESKGEGFVKLWNRMVPKILYERHKFAAFTKNEFSKLNPDISLPTGYYNNSDSYVLASESHKKKRKIPEDISYYRSVNKKDDDETKSEAALFATLVREGALERKEHAYLDGIGGYKRLVKAYTLNPVAALESCSWGSFQIMGEYWKCMGYASLVEFSRAMSRSPKEQIKAFVLYIKYVSPRIKSYLRALDWEAVARAYNGPNYAANKYHTKLKAAYEKFKREE